MTVGQFERKTQNWVVALFTDDRGNWAKRSENDHIEVDLLKQILRARGYDASLSDKAIAESSTTSASRLAWPEWKP